MLTRQKHVIWRACSYHSCCMLIIVSLNFRFRRLLNLDLKCCGLIFFDGRREGTFWRSTPDSGLRHLLTLFWRNWQTNVLVRHSLENGCLVESPHTDIGIRKHLSSKDWCWHLKDIYTILSTFYRKLVVICLRGFYKTSCFCFLGYCGADIKAVCSEAALCALRRRYPQIYSSSQKLVLDVNSITITNRDFMSAMSKMVPAAQRYDQDTLRVHS